MSDQETIDTLRAQLDAVTKERDKLREHHSFYESIQRTQSSHQQLCSRVASAAIKAKVVYNFGACGGGEPTFQAIVAKIEEAIAACEKTRDERDEAREEARVAKLVGVTTAESLREQRDQARQAVSQREAQLLAQLAEARAKLADMKDELAKETIASDKAWTALGHCTELMDPPDGGEPTLAELVGRMRAAWKKAESQRDEAAKLLGLLENGCDVDRPDVQLNGILVTREFTERVNAFLARGGGGQ